VLVAAPTFAASQFMSQQAEAESARAANVVATADECFGASVMALPEGACDDVKHDTLTPSAAFAVDDTAEVYSNGCYADLVTPDLNTCTVGDAASDIDVALIGDSHAASWYPAMKVVAEDNDWSLSPFMKSSCPMSDATKEDDTAEIQRSCSAWNDSLASTLAAQSEPLDLVVLAHSALGDRYGSDKTTIAGFREAWAPLVARGTRVVVIRDIPEMGASTNLCISKTEGADGACDRPEKEAVHDDLMVAAAEGQPGVTVVDMNDLFCRDGSCSPVVGGVVGYRDSHHITATYATTLAPYLEERIEKAVPEVAPQ
jgi:hypothetical protein